MSNAVLAPMLFFGGGVLMVVALSLTMTVLRAVRRTRAPRHAEGEVGIHPERSSEPRGLSDPQA